MFEHAVFRPPGIANLLLIDPFRSNKKQLNRFLGTIVECNEVANQTTPTKLVNR
jgi:hypothetical protein